MDVNFIIVRMLYTMSSRTHQAALGEALGVNTLSMVIHQPLFCVMVYCVASHYNGRLAELQMAPPGGAGRVLGL